LGELELGHSENLPLILGGVSGVWFCPSSSCNL